MFSSLPQYLKDNNLQGDVRTLLLLKKSMERGLVNTIGDLYSVLKVLVTNEQKDIGPFTVAFYQYFLDIEIKPGESLNSAIARSEAFKAWQKKRFDDILVDAPEIDDRIEQFLNEVHLTTYDIKNILSGQDILNKDNPDLEDTSDPSTQSNGELNDMVDYSDIPLEELLERMKRVLAQQKERHTGGNHWVGSGGTSPYGNNGAAAGGVRVGGSGGGKMARKVMNDRNFFPVDKKVTLSDDNIDVALSILKGIEEESVQQYLDIPTTIKEGVKSGGIFLPHQKDKVDQKVQVLLLIDNGGWSMSPYIKTVTKLFSKMKRRFTHDLKTYYYHNTIYGGAYSGPARSSTEFEPIDKICKLDKNYAVFIIGDADMASYELSKDSIQNWQQLNDRFKRCIWLNPIDDRFWDTSYTINVLQQIISMFPLTPDGIEKGVLHMNRKRRFGKAQG